MDTFKMVIVSAGFIAVVISFTESLYPSEKYSRQLKYIFSLIMILTITEPFISEDIEFIETVGSIETVSAQLGEESENVFAYFKTSVENNINTELFRFLEENHITAEEIKTSINISDSGSISINEIEIAVKNTAWEGEIIALIQKHMGKEISVKIKESSGYE